MGISGETVSIILSNFENQILRARVCLPDWNSTAQTITMKEVITGSDQIFTSAHYIIQPLQEYLADREIVSVVDDLYISVGERPANTGWILHVSVGRNQVNDMLNTVIPHLISHNIAFRIPKDIDILNAIVLGMLGTIKYGKILTIYTNSDTHAAQAASLLVALTTPYTPIPVPTDIHLQNCVFTRLGKYLPFQRPLTVIEEAKPLYNLVGEKMDNIQFEPYAFPPDTNWPFSAIISPRKPVAQKIIAGKYYPVSFLRQSLKGHVYLAKYMSGILPKSCVLKQAVAGVSTDAHGRDMRSRLTWQTEILKQLAPLRIGPKVMDLFDDGLTRYLAMERIKGTTIKDFIAEIRKGRLWEDLTVKDRKLLIGCAIKVVQTVHRIHEQGYVHRDLNSENFVIEKSGNIRILDFELSYDLKKKASPYSGGSKGYMSPEQVAMINPTVKEDVYSVGGLLIHFFAGLSPRLFDGLESAETTRRLLFLVSDKKIVELMTTCQHVDPDRRPELGAVCSTLRQLQDSSQIAPPFRQEALSASHIQAICEQLLAYLPPKSHYPYQALHMIPAYQILCQLTNSDDLKERLTGAPKSIYLTALAGLESDSGEAIPQPHLDALVSNQHPEGYWQTKNPQTGKPEILFGLNQGIAGKLMLLLHYHSPGHTIIIKRSLKFLTRELRRNETAIGWPNQKGPKFPNMLSLTDGSLGVALVFINAYQVLDKKEYQDIVERVVFSLPERLVLSEHSFDHGLIGLAHIYMQGFLTFQSDIWRRRLDWMVRYLTMIHRYDQPLQTFDDLIDLQALAELLVQYTSIASPREQIIQQ